MSRIAGLCIATLICCLAGPSWSAEGLLKTVSLERLVVDIPKVTAITLQKVTPLCLKEATIKSGNPGDYSVEPFQFSFTKIMKDAGLQPYEQKDLFNTGAPATADYALGGVIHNMNSTVCFPAFKGGRGEGEVVTNFDKIKGDGSITVEWKLYSRIEKKIVVRATVQSDLSLAKTIDGGGDQFLTEMLAENFRHLAANPDYRAALSGRGAKAGEMIKPETQASLSLDGARAITPGPIDKASASVMVIYAGDALGSGVLISNDGYILTDAHVIGGMSAVRLRWSDGKESIAQVVRISNIRDVALLKADAGGRVPLPLRETPPAVGATVYAIGSPEGDAFQGTLTRGIVSAIRPLNGLNYIQSDVTTGHGGSGGPLLDDKGYVIGLTDLGVGHEATSSGLNFFTPVKDLVEFLNLDLR